MQCGVHGANAIGLCWLRAARACCAAKYPKILCAAARVSRLWPSLLRPVERLWPGCPQQPAAAEK
eukprot:1759581-Pleurochrysis_carterae.AAC.1